MPIEDINSINETKLSLTLQPQDGRDQAENFDESMLDFTWAPISITREYFLIQCEFENPNLISPRNEQDLMILQFLDLENSIFKPEDKTYSPLETKELKFKIKI